MIVSILAGAVSTNFIRLKDEVQLNGAYNVILGDLKLCQNLSMNTSELYINGKYYNVLYGIEIIDEFSYKRVIFSSVPEKLRDESPVIELTENKGAKLVLDGGMTDLVYVVFEKDGRAGFYDFAMDKLSYIDDGPEISVKSEKIKSIKSID
ncbi:MAG: hypothetical protein ACOCWO_03745, partial [Candidatus Muiribacteriaceae bacterium]